MLFKHNIATFSNMPDPVPPREPQGEVAKSTVKVETAERPRLQAAMQTHLVTRDQPLSPEIQQAMNAFGDRQRSLWEKYPPGSPERKRLMNASVNHSQNWALFRDELGMNPNDTDVTKYVNADQGLMTIATNPQTGEVTGFSTALIKDGNVAGVYVGADGSDEYRGRGLGIRLVVLRNLALARMGIRSYETRLWEGSIHMYEKAGMTMQGLSDLLPEEPEELPRLKNGEPSHKVTIDTEELTKLSEELGIDPTKDPFGEPQQLTI